ncbi:peptidoglycan DD-metalloendopeptidase family protein [Streptomyces spiramenti]|uniref:Peptidoglycan DD-metalloendopeptidase family protein n=1 Tax=Streptomyces spiramenti TaxID=2720606 RepID=A0ABX1ALM9_9ACTN|nr:peptidoglycan DD-metalloendopeptidase family protein [Streptomyces spiramenti]
MPPRPEGDGEQPSPSPAAGPGGGPVPAAAAARPWFPGSGGDWPLSPAPALLRLWEPPAAPWAPGHRGVDLAARSGDDVHAAVDGRVTFAGRVAGRDVLVIAVAGTGLRMTHEPVTARVAAGTTVRRGEVVGVVSGGPFHCAEGCVHWGLLDGSTYLDPLSLLRRGPSRLLPVLDVPLPERTEDVRSGGAAHRVTGRRAAARTPSPRAAVTAGRGGATRPPRGAVRRAATGPRGGRRVAEPGALRRPGAPATASPRGSALTRGRLSAPTVPSGRRDRDGPDPPGRGARVVARPWR